MKFELPSKIELPMKSTWQKRLPSSTHAAVFFLIGLLSFTFFRHFILEIGDPYKCQALIDGGHWYGEYGWLIEGCDHVWYGSVEIGRCASRRTIVFAGDDVLQGTFWAIANKLDPSHALTNPGPKSEDFSYENSHVRLEYIWDPYLNSSALMKYVNTFENDDETERPVMLVVGPSQWQQESGAVEQFAGAVQNIAKAAYHNNPRYGLTSGYTQKDGPGDMLLFVPAQEPFLHSEGTVFEKYRPRRDINDELRLLSDQGAINVMWSFGRMTAEREDKFDTKFVDEIYPQNDVFHRRADVLFNLRCNAHLAGRGVNTKTCCGTWRLPNWQQVSFLTLGLLVFPAVVLFDWRRPVFSDNTRKIVRAFSAYTATISLQYITDRTHIFEQVRQLDLVKSNLLNMVIFILIVGAITIRKSPPPKKPNAAAKQPDQPFLPRDQTEEWKGWMQALIITYHMNCAWSLDWFWILIRLCVAAYLFLTGFGHTVYFLQKKDFSFKRFAAVMLRTNLLPVTLAFVLRTEWLNYYYMPLSTFWYFVVYLTMALGRSWNERTPLLLLKIGFAAASIHYFLHTPNLSESIVGFFRTTTKVSFDAYEFFHHRVQIDHYITFVGMLAGIFYLWCKDILGSDKRQDLGARIFRRAFPILKWITVLASAVAMSYFWWTVSSWSQGHWTAQQPTAAIVPILAFTVLRNAHPVLRNYFSFAFAWLGKYSGEMYVMQNHLWLAGDQKAVLRTGLFHGNDTFMGDRWRDLLFTTPLYLIACSIIGDSIATITTWFITERKPPAPPPVVAQESSTAPSRVPEVEMGLLSGKDAEDVSEEIDLNEKPLPRPQGRWQRLWARMPTLTLWPATVGNRAVLLMFGIWVLNWTYT